MYIFAPGAGCTGLTKLVKPGDELIFNSSYNPHEWHTDTVSESHKDTVILYTCPRPVATAGHEGCEYNTPVPEAEIMDLGYKNFSSETMKQVRCVHKMYREWRAHRHANGLQFIQCDLEEKATITAESLKFALYCSITEIKKLDGSDFPGKTLYHIIVCMQFHLECQGLPSN